MFLQSEKDAGGSSKNPRRVRILGEETDGARGVSARVVREENGRPRFLGGDVPTETRGIGRGSEGPENERRRAGRVGIVDDGNEHLHRLAARETNARASGAGAVGGGGDDAGD